MKQVLYIVLFSFTFILAGCSQDDMGKEIDPDVVEEDPISDDTDANQNPEQNNDYGVLIYDEELVQQGYVLVNDVGNNRVYLLDKISGEVVHEWQLEYGIGNDAELLDNGQLLVSLAVDELSFSFGGFGGKIQIINPDNSVAWNYDYFSETKLGHHDVEMLPDGNILFLAWEGKSLNEALEFGYKHSDENIYGETLIEIDPSTNEIVWKWNSWDHTVQNFDQTKSNYGSISENPQLININYRDELIKDVSYNGDIMHANGIEYDAIKDIIYISVNFYSEVWVIDHSTSMTQASSHSGGTYNKGGDLIYRFGNPETYQNIIGNRRFFSNHAPNLIDGSNDKLLIYVNGNIGDSGISTVYELNLSQNFHLSSTIDNEPSVLWSFSDTELFAPKVSSAYRLPNGNTLITEGNFGFWEVTHSKEVVWKFSGDGFYWRGYHYAIDAPAIINLGL